MDRKGWAGSILAGVGLMYLLDPERGRRRRALLRDKGLRSADAAGNALRRAGRDLRNRARGVFAEARSMLTRERVSDEVLVERVRSKLGRVVTHPSAIDVEARDGRVMLSGPALAREVDDLVSCVSAIPGVEEVENRLEAHEQAGEVPGLQGGGHRPEHHFELMQESWSPTARLVAGAAGGGLAAFGAKRRGAAGVALGVFGLGLLARAVSNLKLERLLGVGAGRRGIDVRKTIRVDAPVWEEVVAVEVGGVADVAAVATDTAGPIEVSPVPSAEDEAFAEGSEGGEESAGRRTGAARPKTGRRRPGSGPSGRRRAET